MPLERVLRGLGAIFAEKGDTTSEMIIPSDGCPDLLHSCAGEALQLFPPPHAAVPLQHASLCSKYAAVGLLQLCTQH